MTHSEPMRATDQYRSNLAVDVALSNDQRCLPSARNIINACSDGVGSTSENASRCASVDNAKRSNADVAVRMGGMPLSIECVLIDCVDLDAMTAFWCKALDLDHVWTGPSGGHLLAARDGSERRLALMPVQGKKTSKNRVHFDLRPDDEQRAEVHRLEELGARRVDIGQVDVTWVVMVDPEGNEFCVLRSLAEKDRDRLRHGD